MADLAVVRSALAEVIETIPGLRAVPIVPGQISPPVAIVSPTPGAFIDYEDTFEGSAVFHLRVTVLTGAGADRSSQERMDGYLSSTGATSIPEVIRANPTLGGAVQYCTVDSALGYGLITYARVEYLGCHLLCTAGVL